MIFMSYFLALLIKMDAAGEANRSAIGGFLVAVNLAVILAILSTAWFAMRRMGDNSHDEDKCSGQGNTMTTTTLTTRQRLSTASSNA